MAIREAARRMMADWRRLTIAEADRAVFLDRARAAPGPVARRLAEISATEIPDPSASLAVLEQAMEAYQRVTGTTFTDQQLTGQVTDRCVHVAAASSVGSGMRPGEPAPVGRKVISGYAARYHDPANPGTQHVLHAGLIVERFAAGLFDHVHQDGAEVLALVSHDEKKYLGSTWGGQLSLQADQKGLRYFVTPPDTAIGRAAVADVAAGRMAGASVGFLPVWTRWHRQDGLFVRTIEQCTLGDVGPCPAGAYPAAGAFVRE